MTNNYVKYIYIFFLMRNIYGINNYGICHLFKLVDIKVNK